MRGAIEAGNEVELITLKGKKLGFCLAASPARA